LARVARVDGFALDADGLLLAPVGKDDLAVGDDVRESLAFGPFQRLMQVRRLVREHRDASSRSR